MRVAGVVQARMGSTRLAGKVMKPLAGAPLLQRLLERVGRSRRLDTLVVATSDRTRDDAVAALCGDMAVACFRGSEDDVLGRVLGAAESVDADIVVRLTADNPMVGADLVDYVLERFLPDVPPLVYAQNADDSGFPYGLFVEAITIGALRAADASRDPMDREHVTYFVRTRPDRFPSLLVTAPGRFGQDSVSVDTPEEYEKVKSLFEDLYARTPDFGFRDMMAADRSGERCAP